MLNVHELDQAALDRHMAGLPPRSGLYYQTTPHTSLSTSASLGTGTGRFTPWRVRYPLSITRLGAEITSAGDAGSVLRIGIYADDGTGYPGALVLDAGTIAGDSVAVQEITVAITLPPALYWVGGVVQEVTSTQPTVRTVVYDPSGLMPIATTTPSSISVNRCAFVGFAMTGALPATWPTATPNLSDNAARIFYKVA